MKNKSKPYYSVVFSGKEVPMIGLDQGKGKLYGGLSSHFCFNFFYDASMDGREGQAKETSYNSTIVNAEKLKTSRFVGEGTNLWVEGI